MLEHGDQIRGKSASYGRSEDLIDRDGVIHCHHDCFWLLLPLFLILAFDNKYTSWDQSGLASPAKHISPAAPSFRFSEPSST